MSLKTKAAVRSDRTAGIRLPLLKHTQPPAYPANRLEKISEQLRRLALRRQRDMEDERRHITQLIHEDLAQDLSALRMQLLLLERSLPKEYKALASMTEITDRCIARIRDMVASLRPSVLNLGVVPAVQWLVNDFRRGLELDVALELPPELAVKDEVATFLFRATQEALLNTALHSAAKRISIVMSVDERGICLRIDDDGCGFSHEAEMTEGATGLLGISEQARHLGGELRITSSPGQGTQLRISLPDTVDNNSELFPLGL